MYIDKQKHDVKILCEPGSNHQGYCTVVDKKITGNYRYYDVARKFAGSGIVVPFQRAMEKGYK